MDGAREAADGSSVSDTSADVSILVLLDHARGAVAHQEEHIHMLVSILVLLDHARGDGEYVTFVDDDEFQSLFCWIMLGEPGGAPVLIN